MDREILFKAKHEDNGEWIEGSLLIFPDGTTNICKAYELSVLIKVEVDPETVC